MDIYSNIDLFSVGIAVAGTVTLGVTVFSNAQTSITNRAFLYFSLITGIWGIANYFSYRVFDPSFGLWLIRFALFLAVWQAFFLHRLFTVFPNEEYSFSKLYRYLLIPLTIIISLITLTDFSLSHVTAQGDGGQILKIANGPGMALFGLLAIGLVISGLSVLSKKTRSAEPENKKPYRIILAGAITMFALIITFNFIFPSVLSITSMRVFGAVFILPFVITAFFAIYRHNLMNIKAVTTAFLTALLALVTFSEIIFAETLEQELFRSVIFCLVLIFGVLLIRGIQKEVRQREEINKLAKRLVATNTELTRVNDQLRIMDQRKSEFVSIASHQLRSPVTAIKGYASMIIEESFGEISAPVKGAVEKIFFSSQNLVEMINDFLNVSKIEQGTMTYSYSNVELGKLVQDVLGDLRAAAGQKQLALDGHIPNGQIFTVHVDENKVRQIVTNLLDNAIKYTPNGRVDVYLERIAPRNIIQLRITDTGIGLSQDDLHHLFGKFTRGSEGSKVNAGGSGLGLYVAKKMLEEQKGNIWVDSPGPGKGSTFIIELPEEGKNS